MSCYLTSQQFLRIVAVMVVTIVAAAAVIQSRRGENADVLAPLEPSEADALIGELARCRTITSDDTAGLDACRRIWVENRQRFFVSTKSSQLPTTAAPNALAEPVKSNDQVPPKGVGRGGVR